MHFERGVELYKEQAYRAAVVEFQRAYDLAPDYRLLYNLGRAKFQLHDYVGAAQSFEPYLVQGGTDIPGERRAQVEETLAALKTRVARISIEVNRAGAEVFVDDDKVGVAPLPSLVLTNVGRHRVSARTADGVASAQFVEVAGGDLAEVELRLEQPSAVRAAVSVEPEPQRSRPWSVRRKLALSFTVVGGALLAGSVATGVLALREQDHLDRQVRTLGVDQQAVRSERSKVDALSLTTDVLIGAGAGLAVSGLLLWVLGGQDDQRASRSQAGLRLDAGLGSLALRGQF